ncbi:hypothetical protein BN938_2548 [Mucinivorans hirudinis]|uniref:Helix-turn-helix domain-containing protein n=1 Tax=Mucinivorans hirudinis TaxID=1433126 RepID=A0A060RDY6_9BACT|nr:hypothetical protein BN938_2548 [Mucinivorans hirudinis]
MEIINVDARTWELIMKRIEALADKTEDLCRNTGDKSLKKWLDNQEVCQLLGISKRTLQTYRDNGTLPYTQINHKIYYRPQDVEQAIDKLKSK